MADSVEYEGSSSASASASAGSMMGGTAGSATSGVADAYVAEAEAAAEAQLTRALHESMADEDARIARVHEAAVQESIAQLLGLPPPLPAAPQVPPRLPSPRSESAQLHPSAPRRLSFHSVPRLSGRRCTIGGN